MEEKKDRELEVQKRKNEILHVGRGTEIAKSDGQSSRKPESMNRERNYSFARKMTLMIYQI